VERKIVLEWPAYSEGKMVSKYRLISCYTTLTKGPTYSKILERRGVDAMGGEHWSLCWTADDNLMAFEHLTRFLDNHPEVINLGTLNYVMSKVCEVVK
jgi:hypothetical protein